MPILSHTLRYDIQGRKIHPGLGMDLASSDLLYSQTARQLRTFFRITGFIWILRFAEMARPLSQLLEEIRKVFSAPLTSEPKTAYSSHYSSI